MQGTTELDHGSLSVVGMVFALLAPNFNRRKLYFAVIKGHGTLRLLNIYRSMPLEVDITSGDLAIVGQNLSYLVTSITNPKAFGYIFLL